MDAKKAINHIQELVETDELEQAVEAFRQHKTLLHLDDREAEVISFKARLNALSREQRLGIIDSDRYKIEKNQIRLSIIELLLALQKEVNLKPPPLPKNEPVFRNTDGDQLAGQAIELYRNGNLQQAEKLFHQALQSGLKTHDPAEIYTILGNVYNELERYPEAIEAHLNALHINPEYFKALTNLGIVYRLTAQYAKAEECYLRALKINPDYAELHASLGALYITHHQAFDKAITHLKKAIQLDPGLAIAYSNLALALASTGQFQEAEKNLKTAVLKGYKNAERLKQMIDNLKHT